MPGPSAETKPRFADYTLLQELNRGRLGTLYLAESDRGGSQGQKVLLRVVANLQENAAALRERLHLDLDALGRVRDPQVASPIDIGEHDGHLYYALDYPGRVTLLGFVKKSRPLNAREMRWLGAGLARGLTALHAADLIHGDLWPGKVALTAAGPVIVELGWALRFKDVALNRPAGAAADHPGDLRGLGATLVFAVTGSIPRPGPKLPPAWAEASATLTPEQADLIVRLLGPSSGQPGLAEVVTAFAPPAAVETADGSVDPSLDEFLAAMSGMGKAEASATDAAPIVAPHESETGEGDIAFVETITVDSFAGEPVRFGSSPTRAAAPPAVHRLREGVELDHLRVLGKGGMGIVHLVNDRHLGRHAALKLILGTGSANRVRRFERETKVTARLDHPGVPPVYEAGKTLDGEQYLLMQFVDGDSMASILDEKRKTNPTGAEHRDLLSALVKVSEAVAYAHSRRIVHRDLKPANIMLGSFGEVFVMDWGLARDLRDTKEEDDATCSALGVVITEDLGPTDITREGAIMGTLGYIPPEQAKSEEIDALADVFSLGAILTEILTGKPPVVGSNPVEVLGLTRAGQIETPLMRNQDLNPELGAIAAKALTPDRRDRYQSAKDFAVDLQAYLEGRNVSCYRYRPTERARRLVRRHPTIATALAVGIAGTVIGAALLARTRAEQQRVRHDQCLGFIAQGQAALKDGDPSAARTHFLQALALERTHPTAVIGKHQAEETLKRLRQNEKQIRDRRQAATLTAQARQHLEGGKLDAARRAFGAALTLHPGSRDAAEGLGRLKGLLEEREVSERRRDLRARDARQAKRHVDAGRGHLKKSEYGAARDAFVKAIAFGSTEASALLTKAEEGLLEERLKERQREVRRRDQREARRLVKSGHKALRRGRLNTARTAFLQALAFEGRNAEAQSGLVDVDRALRRRSDQRDRKKRMASARLLLARARKLREQGKAAITRRAHPARAREAYFGALVLYDRSLALVPGQPELRREKLAVVSEVATLLKSQGRLEFAEFLLRYGGVKQDTVKAPAKDATLVFQEADAVTIRNAYGGSVHFAPPGDQVFRRLRQVLANYKDRYRVLVLVRSKTTDHRPPKVHLTGFWLRVQDRVTRTAFPTKRLLLEGGPYPRPVTVSPEGRVVGSFEKAHSLDADRWEKEVVRLVREVVGNDRD